MSNIKDLNIGQQDELIQQYSQLVVDSMDLESLEQFVYQTLKDDFSALSNSELKDEIKYSFDEETLDELVDNVPNETVEVKWQLTKEKQIQMQQIVS